MSKIKQSQIRMYCYISTYTNLPRFPGNQTHELSAAIYLISIYLTDIIIISTNNHLKTAVDAS